MLFNRVYLDSLFFTHQSREFVAQHLIIGAGMTGLSAGVTTGFPVYEARPLPGGICSSYYMQPNDPTRYQRKDINRADCYRFEYGGGHWIFGGDPEVLKFIDRFVSVKRYARSSAVFFPDERWYVPYPLQYHLAYLPEPVRNTAYKELMRRRKSSLEERPGETMADWVRRQFGATLYAKFFAPFHQRYTAGLWTQIRPQDNYKTPVDKKLVEEGARSTVQATGYNAEFVYPRSGLDRLATRMAAECDIHYNQRVVSIDVENRLVTFESGFTVEYERVYATVPLRRMVRMAGIDVGKPADPYSSVLVLNIGAERGDRCPAHHWLYLPSSNSGFHRIGFYSNVDPDFVPHQAHNRVGLYVERAFLPSQRPEPSVIEQYKREAIRELQDWGMIGRVEVNDATWVEVAYTWSMPGSTWVETAIQRLEEHGITMIGRYGRWQFQGIAASIREGLALEKAPA